MRFKQLGASALGQIPTPNPIGGQCKRTVAPERAHKPRARRHLSLLLVVFKLGAGFTGWALACYLRLGVGIVLAVTFRRADWRSLVR